MSTPEIQILVCTNDRGEGAQKASCGARGSLEVYRRFKDRLRELGLRERVWVTRTGCLRYCSRGTTVAIWPANAWYGGVTLDDVEELITAAAEGGDVERLRMPDVPTG
jgi:(2Fe-2S) ferredoxin